MRKRGPLKLPPPPVQTVIPTPEEQQEIDYDICCSIEEIESILSKNPTEKQKKFGEVSLKILKNPGESLIKKKQVMRQWFDDYKKKFENKKKQISVNLKESKCTFKNTKIPLKSVYYKKHEVKTEQIVKKPEVLKSAGEKNKECIHTFEASENLFKFKF